MVDREAQHYSNGSWYSVVNREVQHYSNGSWYSVVNREVKQQNYMMQNRSCKYQLQSKCVEK